MMRKSKSVPLVLLGSSLLLAGCIAHKTPCTSATQPEGDGPPVTCTGGRSSGGGGHAYYYHHWYSPWGTYYGGGGGSARPAGPAGARPGAGVIRSGGFGGVGHAMSGGS
jgi:hypothetical protein